MNSRRTASSAASALVALAILTACSSGSTENPASGATPTNPAAGTSAGIDRSQADAVAAAFAADYAGGNTPAACTLTTGSATKKMTSQGMCAGLMSWNEVPRQIVTCTQVGNVKRYAYEVEHEIARFLIFSIRVELTNGTWSVAALGMSTPGDGDYGCQPLGANNGNG